jgi:DNA-binding CsgD family transcriptional regulator
VVGAGLERGREALRQRRWADAYRWLVATTADERTPVDCERLAVAAYLVGKDDESTTAWESAFDGHLRAGDPAQAASCAFWLAFGLLLRGHPAQANGWLSRARTTIAEGRSDCAATGYLLVADLLRLLESGEAATAQDMAVEAVSIGVRLRDPDLHALGTLGHGQALLGLGDTTAGTAKLDEVMLSVSNGEVGPITTGIVYCAVIVECMHALDLSRAAEWTAALNTWCEVQPDLVPYRGQCLVHRSQLQQAAGEWVDAVATAAAACRRLAEPPHPALGLAYYQQAELHRLRGAFDDARAAYRLANRAGYQPVPGLALLELSCGDPAAAAAAMGRCLQEVSAVYERPALLAAAVEIFAATGDVGAARRAADELAHMAAGSTAGALRASAGLALGTVLLAEGDAATALGNLRAAAATWRETHMPYELARTCVLLAQACAQLGDRAAAALELDTAIEIFVRLGARPDAAAVRSLISGSPSGPREGANPLSAREREVLTQVAAGRTNREIANALVISEHTVGRHLENIFAKLAVPSRAAATAYAVEHRLL